MSKRHFVSPDEIRARFAQAMSDMYSTEVPHYATLLDIVAQVNSRVLSADSAHGLQSARKADADRLNVERHGAIRLGTDAELFTMRRLFSVMGMHPVGYYDLSVAGVPVHSTAFRPLEPEALARNPFRVFTSLLRLDLISDKALREEAATILRRRQIFSAKALQLIDRHESEGGLTSSEAIGFVGEALKTFRWHREATVDAATYQKLHASHRLIADVVCFKGPHINHLTPRVLDIDAAHKMMSQRGLKAKDVIEGPPQRQNPVLLRQTSFKALEERVIFGPPGSSQPGAHSARFGEIEQRGIALTRKGRALYDQLLSRVSGSKADSAPEDYRQRLNDAFTDFPDDLHGLRKTGLAFFTYELTAAMTARLQTMSTRPHLHALPLEVLIEIGAITAEPITYEDFLPVSAAGIFQSNLGHSDRAKYVASPGKPEFEKALGTTVLDEISLYEQIERQSIANLRATLRSLGERQGAAQ